MKKHISAILCTCIIFLSLFSFSSCGSQKIKYSKEYYDYFDTVTRIIGWADSEAEFDTVCDDVKNQLEFYHKRYDIYTSYDNINNLATVNSLENGEHKEVKVDKAVAELLVFCKDMHQKTEGKLNVAMGSVLSIWHQYRSRWTDTENPSEAELPQMKALKEAELHTDINNLIIDEQSSTVYLKDGEATLDVGAVAKGYATERIAEYLSSNGITGYCINIGGNVRVIGSDNAKPWTVGIENPDSTENYLAVLELEDTSLVTSGNYQRFYVVDGKSYHHIIDPDTLMPCEKYKSVSVITKDSGVADALSTTLFLMDYEEGKALLQEYENTEAMWVLNNGEIKYSQGFREYIKK